MIDTYRAFVAVLAVAEIGFLVAFLVALRRLVRKQSVQRPDVEFFADRSRLPLTGVRDELLSGTEVWAMWPSGYVLPALPTEAIRRIKRLILSNPLDSPEVLAAYAAEYFIGSVDHVRQVIHESTRVARANDVPVKWHSSRHMSVVISEPQSRQQNGRIRLELLIPFTQPSDRPSLVILQQSQPQLFKSIVHMFEERWKQGVDPIGIAGDPKLSIDSARYGFGERWRDVSNEVRQQIRNNSVDFQVGNEILNCDGERDPFKGQKKFLEVQHSIGGVRRDLVGKKEKQQLVLPVPENRPQ